MHHVQITSHPTVDDIDQLEELMEAATLVDGHEPIGEHKFLRVQHGDDLVVSFLAYKEGQLVGYAHTLAYGSGPNRRLSCEMVVHPKFRRRGISRSLLQSVIEHAESHGAYRLDFWAYNDSPASRYLARSFRLIATRKLLHMHRHSGDPPTALVPPGARIRPFQPGEDEAWLELNNRVFSRHPEQGEWSLEDFHVRTAQSWFRAEDLLMLEVEGRPAGFCWLKVKERGEEDNVGEIYIIGVDPNYHGRGLGKYLLAQGLAHLHRRDVDTVAVYVDHSNHPAVALYESFEFHHHHMDVCYSMPLTPAPKEPETASAAKRAPSGHLA